MNTEAFLVPIGSSSLRITETDVYFGVKMSDEDKKDVIQLIDDGPFTPQIWQTKTHHSKYELEFEAYKP